MQTTFTYDCDEHFVHFAYKFTGKERDAESGLAYFGARYYASAMGRWMSPDWSAKEDPVPYAKLDDPQTLNLYGYVRNNPLSQTDPDGHCCVEEEETTETGLEVGAEVGSFFGPEGTVIGGAIGGLVGLRAGIYADYKITHMMSNSPQPAAAPAHNEEHTEASPEPQTSTNGAGARKGGGDNADTKLGRDKHQEFTDKAKAKGWETGKRYTDPATGKTVIPDAVTKTGHPVELKPNTPRGRAR